MAAHVGRVGLVGLAVIAVAVLGPIASTADERASTLVADAALSAYLSAVDEALARQDLPAASQQLQAAYQAALASRRWHGMLAYGDASLRVAEASGTRQFGMEQARRAYLLALYRARSAGSVDGALAATYSFALLGDQDVAHGCLAIARRLARTAEERARVRALTARLEDRQASIPTF